MTRIRRLLAKASQPGRVSWDNQAKAAYIYASGIPDCTGVARTVTVWDNGVMVNVDLREDGSVFGVEVLT